MGPDFGRGFVEGLIGLGVALVLLGMLVGIGCQAGCRYLDRHVDVEWKP